MTSEVSRSRPGTSSVDGLLEGTRSTWMRFFLLPALLGVAILLGCIFWLSGLWHRVTDPHFTFVSWADTKSGYEVLSGLSNQAALLDPVLTIYQGDLLPSNFDSDAMDLWKKAMDGGNTGPNGMLDIAFLVRGNHDRGDIPGWQASFDLRTTADRVGAANYTNMPGQEELTYSFDYENAHFIGVDVLGGAHRITKAQVQWIDAGLGAAAARGLTHAFIYFHGPIYCIDGHCPCAGRVCPIHSEIQELISVLNHHPIVSATFHGHEHTHAHTHVNRTRIPPDGSFAGVTRPFHQFVAGSAGARTKACKTHRCDFNMAEHGFAAVEVNGPRVAVTFYRLGSTDPVHTVRFSKER